MALITVVDNFALRDESRTPHGVRGLKSMNTGMLDQTVDSRTPHGVRGLK